MSRARPMATATVATSSTVSATGPFFFFGAALAFAAGFARAQAPRRRGTDGAVASEPDSTPARLPAPAGCRARRGFEVSVMTGRRAISALAPRRGRTRPRRRERQPRRQARPPQRLEPRPRRRARPAQKRRPRPRRPRPRPRRPRPRQPRPQGRPHRHLDVSLRHGGLLGCLAVQQFALDHLLRAGVAALADAGALADTVTQVVELRAPDVTAGGDLDLLDLRRVQRERALDADTERLLADGEGLACAVALALDDNALKDLGAAASALDHLEVDAQAVACVEMTVRGGAVRAPSFR